MRCKTQLKDNTNAESCDVLCFCWCCRWSEESSFNREHSGQRKKEKELKMGLRSSDKFEMARNGQEIDKLRNRVTTKNIPDEGHYGFLFW